MIKPLYLFLLLLSLAGCKEEDRQELQQPVKEESHKQLSEKVAAASGIENWDTVEKVDFTFNVERNGERVVSRDWSWKPKSGAITMTARDTTIAYNREQPMDSTSIGYDRSFINDVYWLLPQFKMIWDKGTDITYPEDGGKQLIRIKYTGNDGYTPGDQYDLVVDENNMITQWTYYASGSTSPSMITSFEDYQDHEGIKIATNHVSPDKSTRIYFTEIEITAQ